MAVFFFATATFPAWTLDVDIAFEDRETGDFGRGIDAEVSGVVERNFLAGEIESDLVLAEPVDVGHALDEVDDRDALAGIAEAKRAEFDRRVRSEAQRAAIFELDLGASAIMRPHLRPLRNGEVEKRAFEAHASVLVDLNRTLYIAQAHDARLRTGHCGQRKKRAGGDRQNHNAESGARESRHSNPRKASFAY